MTQHGKGAVDAAVYNGDAHACTATVTGIGDELAVRVPAGDVDHGRGARVGGELHGIREADGTASPVSALKPTTSVI